MGVVMANINLGKWKTRPADPGRAREVRQAHDMLDRPGYFKAGQRADAKKILKELTGVKRKEKWGPFGDSWPDED